MIKPPTTTWIAVGLLTLMSILAFISLRGDSAIDDEVPHLAAGYSYVTRGDMRLNPEHPPLTKDLAGLAVVMWSAMTRTPIVFPSDLPSWTTATNAQWTFSPIFLYQVNHHSAEMIFWARLPTLIIYFGFGLWLFRWIRRRWNAPTALLTLFFYAVSPTVLAHARFVTTDLAATVAFFASFAAFLKWIERPTWRQTLLFGLVIGLAELTKFSLILLLPLFPLMIMVKFVTGGGLNSWRAHLRRLVVRLGQYLLAISVAYGLVVTPVYMLHTLNYPVAKEQQDVEFWQSNFAPGPLAAYVHWSVGKPVFRALGQYVTGVLLVQNRSQHGNTTFFRGVVDNVGHKSYFPIVYAIKEPLAFHILSLVALLSALVMIIHAKKSYRGIPHWINDHLAECTALVIIAWYWWTSIHSQLNIGIRHILPTLPFIYFLVSRLLIAARRQLWKQLGRLRIIGLMTLGGLLAWQFVSVVSVHPSYLAYFNALAGGPSGGAQFVTDSNLDWGQDLTRLATFAKQQGVQLMHIDYFGGGDPLSAMPGVARIYHVDDGPVTGWLAVSQTYLTNERGVAGPHLTKSPNRYAWLDAYQPVTIIGHSMVVYHIPTS